MGLIMLKIGFPFLLLVSLHVDRAMSCTHDHINHRCSTTGNYTAGSVYELNMEAVFSTLTKDAPPFGFSNVTVGQGSETVYGLVQCRGDVDQQDCKACIFNSTIQIVEYCPNTMDAIIWYQKCQLRYSNTDFFGKLNVDDSGGWHWTSGKVTDSKGFNEKLGHLLKDLTSLATTEPASKLMFATGNIPYTDLQTIYGLAQCTRDTSLADCKQCLDTTRSQIPTTCDTAHGCEIATGSCRVVYDTQLFYHTTTDPSLLPQSNSASGLPPQYNSGSPQGAGRNFMFVIIVILIVVLATCVLCGFYWWRRQFCCFERKKLNPSGLQRNEEEEETIQQQVEIISASRGTDAMDGLRFDLATIRFATNDFAPANKLGKGGFGAVYRGQLLDGQEIAVKRLSCNIGNGPKQFHNEVQTLAKLQHRNLVRLLGGYMEGEEKMLIYEYVRNASLNNFLFEPTKRLQLDWAIRSNLINGTARGLLYLHEESRLRIVHRDLKASNVLLDEDMIPKISDFGTARIFNTDQTQAETNEIMGTRGHMAPEYLLEGKVSVKIDVFSFGVLLLEIISGKQNFYFCEQQTNENLLNYAWRVWRENRAMQNVDEILEGAFDKNEILRCIHIGLLCVQEDASSRPKMSAVVAMLENGSLILPAISPPAPSIWKTRNISLAPQTISTTSGTGPEFGSSSY
ncbi:cysteine-rich receptor-like protein kinase 25 [Nymphaea colorata]|nr:cysteine-rich receptor-like protein kinase 25 [Nymphaea colorata]